MEFIFSEYDGDKDGLLTRKEFFTVRECGHACSKRPNSRAREGLTLRFNVTRTRG